MSRKMITVSREQLTSLNLEAFVAQAAVLNQRNREAWTTPFPKAPERWLSRYQFMPRSIAFTSEGEVEGGLSWLIGATFDLSFTRSICAPKYGARGGHCYDPVSLVVLEVAAKVDQYVDYASFCLDLRQQDKGRRYRELAGLHTAIPGEDDLSHFRSRIGTEAIETTMGQLVGFFRDFGLIKGDIIATDGQLEPSYARFKGCAYACKDCRELPVDEANRQELGRQLQSGAKRLKLTCPFPDVVDKVLQATAKKGTPKEPEVALLEIEYAPQTPASLRQRRQVAALLGVPEQDVPTLHVKWSHLEQSPQGELFGSCPKIPSDLEAGVGYHIDTKNPSKTERVFGYLHQKTTDINSELGLELPLGNSTYAGNANEATEFIQHRATVALPVEPGQVQINDAGYDSTAIYTALHDQGAIPVIAYNRRNENLDPEALLERGYDQNGTPYAPCGRLCHSNGYDYQAGSRQYACGRRCPPEEQEHCPHRYGVLGYSHRMSFADYPRLIGPIQRGSPLWKRIYAIRTSSERTNSYDQEVIAKSAASKLRGLAAFRFAGIIRTLAQLLRRTCNFVLDVTYTLGKLQPLRT
ncbi:MAG: hypothetical protein V3R80_00385 [Candidatus Tectomicrobia bacterium]